MKTIDKAKALHSLKYAGLMGHKFVGLGSDYRVSIEANSFESAQKEVPGGSVWQQLPKRKWKQLS